MLVMALQASIYIAVDMLPLPGSQGISELMYVSVFSSVFTDALLAPSMCVTRGLSFYFLLTTGACTALFIKFVPITAKAGRPMSGSARRRTKAGQRKDFFL